MIKQVKKGLTLIELVVTIAVVAVLTGAAVGTYFGVTESNKHSRAESEALTFYGEIQNKIIVSKEFDGYKVNLGKDGLIFSRYNQDTIDDFVEQVSAIEHRYNAVIGASVQNIKDYVEPQEKPTVYFFNTNYRNDTDVAEVEYFGYVPSGFAGTYVKVVDLKSGSIVNNPSFTVVPYKEPGPAEVPPVQPPVDPIPVGTKITKNLYLYAPEFSDKVGITQKYLKDGIVSHYESRNYDCEIDYVGQHTFRFLYTYIYGYENIIQFGDLNDNSKYTREIAVTDAIAYSEQRYMHVPGIYDWQSFDINDYNNDFEYFLVGTIAGTEISNRLGRYGLARRKILNEENKEYRIEQVYLKEGDKLAIKPRDVDNLVYNYTNLDDQDKNFIDKDTDNNLVIKTGYSGLYSFYIKPNVPGGAKIYATADLDNKLTFANGFINYSADVENDYVISHLSRQVDSAENFSSDTHTIGPNIKFKMQLGATSEYAEKNQQISGKLSINIETDATNVTESDFKLSLTTTKSIYYNVEKTSAQDDVWYNKLHDETIGNIGERTLTTFSNDFYITVLSSITDLRGFEHKVEISCNKKVEGNVNITVNWCLDETKEFVRLAHSGSDNWQGDSNLRLSKNLFFEANTPIRFKKEQTWDESYPDEINGLLPDFMYMIENVVFTENTQVKIRVKVNNLDHWVNPGVIAFNNSNNNNENVAKIDDAGGSYHNFVLEAGVKYRIYCFSKTYNGTTYYVAAEAHKM